VVAGSYPADPIGTFVLARSAAYAGHFDEAIATYEESVPLELDPYFYACLGEAYALAGRREEALRIALQVEAQVEDNLWNAEGLFCIYAALGDREEALRWLEYEPPSFSLPWVWAHPKSAGFRDDPRFLAVFRWMNLEFEPGRPAPVPVPVAPPELPGLGSPTPQ
jgi:hypothetical protein